MLSPLQDQIRDFKLNQGYQELSGNSVVSQDTAELSQCTGVHVFRLHSAMNNRKLSAFIKNFEGLLF